VAPPLPEKQVGENPTQGSGNRTNSGPLTPDNGGTGDSPKDFDSLTGGDSGPAPEGSNYPAGTRVGESGIALRPPAGDKGARIDILRNGDKSHETLHYPLPPPTQVDPGKKIP
jgi:filamentous hemagglutinin